MDRKKYEVRKMIKIKRTGLCMVFLFHYFVACTFAAFEDMEIGARATSMGGAFVSQADDASGLFYNPAGLSIMNRPEILTSYEKLYWGLSDNSFIGRQLLSIGMPVNLKGKYWGGLGFGWHILSLDSLYSESIIKLGYSYPVKKKLHVGLGISQMKVDYGRNAYTEINPVFDNGYSKSAIGLDIGAIYKGDNINFGLAVLNINQPDLGLKYKNTVTRAVSGGITIKRWIFDLNVATVYKDSNFKFKTGIETWIYKKVISLRGGVNIGASNYRNIAAGIGYRDSWYELAYSMNYPLSGIADTRGFHQLSLIFRWGKVEKKEDEWTWKDFQDFVNALKGKKEEPRLLPEQEVKERIFTAESKAKVSNLIKESWIFIEKGDLFKAQKNLEAALKIWKDHVEVKILFKTISPIAEIYSEIKEKDKKSGLVKKAIVAFMYGKGKKALNRIRYASQLWPDDEKISQLRKLIEKNFPDLAEQEKLVPGLTIIDQKLQRVLEDIYAGKFVSAITLCEEILDLKPKSILALLRLGSAYWAMDKTEKAKNVWKKALKLSPDNEQLLEFLKMRKKIRKRKITPAKEVTKEREDEYRKAFSYYERVKKYGAKKETLKVLLKRMIKKFEGTEIDISYLYKELEKNK